jgi:hypothetical protein
MQLLAVSRFVNLQQKGNENVVDFYKKIVATKSTLEADHILA